MTQNSIMKIVPSQASHRSESHPSLTATLAEAFQRCRAKTLDIARPLSPEDCQAQSMADASPIKWHLAHVTWFFETFILSEFADGYVPFDPDFKVLFNSYYQGVGARHPRPERGLITRPTLARVIEYREHVDSAMLRLFHSQRQPNDSFEALITLGINHEQQHQELMLTDVKHLFSLNPTATIYAAQSAHPKAAAPHAESCSIFSGGVIEIGRNASEPGFAFDNESPRHRVYAQPFELANHLVTNRDYLAFIADGGYSRHELWLSDGFDAVGRFGWQAPLYWRADESGQWHEFTLSGMRPLELDAPVCHVSFFEADAYARWAEARLPTEAEWEHAATSGNSAIKQLHEHVWQWTASAYLGYPGFKTAAGAVGEYNGKFMCNQFVLRGSSCATPSGHARSEHSTYRNFFQADKRWQFTGIRLAR
jgi:ergothioneine biosynthesis protein EgtB